MGDEPASQYWLAFWLSWLVSVGIAGAIWVAEPTQFPAGRTAWAWFTGAAAALLFGYTVLRTRLVDLDDDEWLEADVRSLGLRPRITEPVLTFNRFVVRAGLAALWVMGVWFAADDGRVGVTGSVIAAAAICALALVWIVVRRRQRALAAAASTTGPPERPAVELSDQADEATAPEAPMPAGQFLGQLAGEIVQHLPFGH